MNFALDPHLAKHWIDRLFYYYYVMLTGTIIMPIYVYHPRKRSLADNTGHNLAIIVAVVLSKMSHIHSFKSHDFTYIVSCPLLPIYSTQGAGQTSCVLSGVIAIISFTPIFVTVA